MKSSRYIQFTVWWNDKNYVNSLKEERKSAAKILWGAVEWQKLREITKRLFVNSLHIMANWSPIWRFRVQPKVRSKLIWKRFISNIMLWRFFREIRSLIQFPQLLGNYDYLHTLWKLRNFTATVFCKNSVKSTFYNRTLLWIDLTEKKCVAVNFRFSTLCYTPT